MNDRDNNQPGCNDGLGKCAQFVRQLAAKYHAEVIDLHAPMTAFNLERQQKDPAFTIVGSDRVHPGSPGNLMMAWLFLKAQGAPALVSNVEFDAARGRVVQAANAKVSNIQQTTDGWKFTVLEQALPYPVEAQATEGLDTLPLEQDLNQEIVKINGLKPGRHELLIDGEPVACQSAAEWSDGINLALNQATPQTQQAKQVAQINEERRRTEVVLRNYAAVRWFLRRHVNPDDLPAVKTYAETKMGKTGYFERQVPTYLKEWEQRGNVIAQVAEFENKALQARIPVPHTYEIRPAR